jgi:hypothetical protein
VRVQEEGGEWTSKPDRVNELGAEQATVAPQKASVLAISHSVWVLSV